MPGWRLASALSLLPLALAALALAGCSGEPGPPSGKTVKVGAVFDFTGDLSEYGPRMRNAASLAVEVVNDAGGVLGRPLEAVYRDGATDGQTSSAAALDLIEGEGVEVIIGPVSSGATLQVATDVTTPRGVLHISPAATSPVLTTLDDGDFFFRARVSDNAQGVVLARLARELGYDTAAVMHVDNAFGEELARVFREGFEGAGGTVTAVVSQSPGRSTYAAQLMQAVRDAPDVLVVMSYPESLEVYLREALDGGYIDTFLFSAPARSQRVFDALGPSRFEGLYGTDVGSPVGETTLAFRAMYEDRYVESASAPLIAEAFDVLILAALAIERAGKYEGATVRDALRQVSGPPGEKVGPLDVARALELVREGRDVDYQGVSGPLDFDGNGDVLNDIEIWRIVDGKITSTGRYETP